MTRKDHSAAVRRLEAAGWELVEDRIGKFCWQDPDRGRVLPEESALSVVIEHESAKLKEAGWEPEEYEGELYWRRPDSGRLYPHEAAVEVHRTGAGP